MRFLGWPPAVLATLITAVLVAGELTNAGQRRWWAARSLTTDTVSGLLVLLITVLVVNQLLIRRQNRQRGHAVAAQAAIMGTQAARAVQAVSALRNGSGDRDAADDGFRTYMMMLLMGAPVLIDDPVARHFLEQAQYLGGLMARTLAAIDKAPNSSPVPATALTDAAQQLQSAAAPLLQQLSPDMRNAITRIGQTAEELGEKYRPGVPRLRFETWGRRVVTSRTLGPGDPAGADRDAATRAASGQPGSAEAEV